MRLYTSPGLAYPLTVTRLLQHDGSTIAQDTPLFTYSYVATNIEWDDDAGEDVTKRVVYYSDFESEVEGTVTSLDVAVGQVIRSRSGVAEIEEPCRHEVQFGGMCANCGKDMTIAQYNTTLVGTERAKINSSHKHTALRVSHQEASKEDEETKRRLLDTRKLILVVDLDQTIIQATVDPTVDEWQRDTSNPNYEAVKDVRKFQLPDDAPSARGGGNWYYIKLRPHLTAFLALLSTRYEMHIYTMATRAYATEIAKLVDPDRKIFADRILSRDENGSFTAKSLTRLFPVDSKMVVIIDDRGDVWSWSPNLVKVSVFDFFVGIGDINGAFLPKRPELEAAPKKKLVEDSKTAIDSADGTTSVTSPHTNGDAATSAVDRLVSMAGSQDSNSIKSKTDEQDSNLAAQLTERPLLQKQKLLEHAVEEAEAKCSPAVDAAKELLLQSGNEKDAIHPDDDMPVVPKYRHNLLQDDDTELEHLGRTLSRIHQAYYEEYDKSLPPTSRIADLRPTQSKKRTPASLDRIPDAARVISDLKSSVLSGVHLVFTGVVPLGVGPLSHDLAILAMGFGAVVTEDVTRKTTHVVASADRRTAKVKQAARKGKRIAIVGRGWLDACFQQWKRVDESPYHVHTDVHNQNANAMAIGLPDSFDSEAKDYGLLSSSDDEAARTETEDEAPTPNGRDAALLVDTDTDVEEQLQQYQPSLARVDSSPTEAEANDDWDALQGELDDFLGSEAEDLSDTESIISETAGLKPLPARIKRKFGDFTAEANGGSSGDETDGDEGSRLQKRKKEALARTSSLTNVAVAAAKTSALASTDRDPGGGAVVDSDDDDLEAALAAEMEKQSEEDAAL